MSTLRALTWAAKIKDEASSKIGQINDKFSGLSGQMKKLSGGMQDIGGKLSKTVTAPLFGVGVAALKSTSDFDDGMSKVRALTGATGKEFDDLRNKAIQLGNDTAFSAKLLAA